MLIVFSLCFFYLFLCLYSVYDFIINIYSSQHTPKTKNVCVTPGSILSVESNQNVESKTKNVESKIAFVQLILRKIIKTVATGCQILRQKCTKIQNSAGAPPDSPSWI